MATCLRGIGAAPLTFSDVLSGSRNDSISSARSSFFCRDPLFSSSYKVKGKSTKKCTIEAKSLNGGRKSNPKGGFHTRQGCRLACCFKGPLVQRPSSVRKQQFEELEGETKFGEQKSARDWRTQVAQVDAPVKEETREGGKMRKEQLDWSKTWYPVAIVEDLDPKKPKGIMVIGRRLVLWRDQNKKWQCHLDACPHRFAPLSQGRIHESGGLQCSYHGWVFGSEGNCTLIPQADEQEKKLVGSKKACAVALPIKEEAGLLWVWPDEHSAAEAAANPPKLDPTLTNPDFVYQWVYRELPYNWDTLVENVLDPAHVNFAHHKVQGKREAAKPIEFGIAEPTLDGFTVEGQGTAGPAPVPSVSFVAPASVVYHFTIPKKDVDKPWEASLLSLGTPIAPGRVAIFAAFPRNFLKFAAKWKPRWIDHVTTRNKVLDGDLVLLQGQEVLSMQAFKDFPAEEDPDARNAASSRDSAAATRTPGFADRRYYMPTKSDRPIAAFRKWVKDFADGGPTWPVGFRTTPNGLSDRPEVIMDRFSQHTEHCSACMGAYKNVQRLQSVSKFGIVASIAAAAALSGQQPVLSQGLAVLAVALTGAIVALQRLEREFVYVGYDHTSS